MINSMKNISFTLPLVFLLSFLFSNCVSQKNNLASDLEKEISFQNPKNPFSKFIGEWTLKDDNWSQNWGQGDEHIKIPHHHTICRQLNTDNSLLAVIDGTPPYGHIFWSYNPVKKEVNHLSSFGTTRAGVGKGTVNENGDVSLKISFADEAEGTYRLYTYKWISENEYVLKSIQYDANDKPTGFFYGGTFVRIQGQK
jgi:hypothetical protein